MSFSLFSKYLRSIPLCINKFSSACTDGSTIFAVSSGHGKCGVAVIRVSGNQAGTVVKLLTSKELPKPRYAMLRSIKNPQDNEILDKGLVLWFPGPRSYTGEDSCEFHVHGGLAVITSILKALGSLQNVRLAEPGEFTRRAFYNGKLDLTEIEGIADLMAAETEFQRKQAFLQTQGHLSKVYHEWKNILVKCLASVEAYIEFGETDALELDLFSEVTAAVTSLSENIRQHLSDGRKGERLRNGVKAVILGEPNVGKSSLFNILCRRPAAIVTSVEGTTRDVLEVMLDIGGYPLVLADTAGLRSETDDIVEKEGISRALKAYLAADLIFLVIDCSTYLKWHQFNPEKNFVEFLHFYVLQLNITDFLNNNDEFLDTMFNKPCLIVANKIDLISSSSLAVMEKLNQKVNLVSCDKNTGFQFLVDELTLKLKVLCGEPTSEHPSMNQMRHRQHLTDCLSHLEAFLSHNHRYSGTDVVLITEEIRKALHQLGKITGTVTTEQLLDVIFKEFCIGK